MVCSDVAFGYFSQLEFSSGLEISLPFTREICNIVRRAMDERDKIQVPGLDSVYPQDDDSGPPGDSNFGLVSDTMDFDSNVGIFQSYVSIPRVCVIIQADIGRILSILGCPWKTI